MSTITISDDILNLIDANVEEENRRSAFIEQAQKAYLEVLKRRKIDRRERDQGDLEIINRLSEILNNEAEDVLAFQKDVLQ